jgi:predicted acyl esterase
VSPGGTAWNLSTPGTLLHRASYRDGGPKRQLMPPGETVRLRVVITPAFAPVFSVNPQTGAQEFETDSVRAGEIRVVHALGVSRIVLPTVSGSERPAGAQTGAR